jgi:transcriptional regulator with XRE-family HTH domain
MGGVGVTCQVIAGPADMSYGRDMTTMDVAAPRRDSRQLPVGELLRQWRERRRLSQLDLAIEADISTRHLSFVETGRSKPSSDMILRITEQLDVPLRERNRVLLAGGFAPIYPETELAAPEMTQVRAAIRQVLEGHDPYPALVIDGHWNLLDANDSVALLTDGIPDELLAAPANVLRLSLHPDGLAPRILNQGEWRAHILGRLRRQVNATADPELGRLYAELQAYPCDQPEPDISAHGDVVVPLRVRAGDRELSFFSITALFGTPQDLTVAELAIESFYPADDATREFLTHPS